MAEKSVTIKLTREAAKVLLMRMEREVPRYQEALWVDMGQPGYEVQREVLVVYQIIANQLRVELRDASTAAKGLGATAVEHRDREEFANKNDVTHSGLTVEGDEVENGARDPDRAVVAISEDRQWLVMLDLDGKFLFYQKPNWQHFFRLFEHDGVKDNGQSADEVLAAFLEGRRG